MRDRFAVPAIYWCHCFFLTKHLFVKLLLWNFCLQIIFFMNNSYQLNNRFVKQQYATIQLWRNAEGLKIKHDYATLGLAQGPIMNRIPFI